MRHRTKVKWTLLTLVMILLPIVRVWAEDLTLTGTLQSKTYAVDGTIITNSTCLVPVGSSTNLEAATVILSPGFTASAGSNLVVSAEDPDGMSNSCEMDAFGNLNHLPGDDADGDGLTNSQECILGYNPNSNNSDNDGDGLPDWWEVQYFGLNLGYSGSGDPDNDELTNLQEYQQGTNPQDSDSDNDGMPDGWEVQNGLNPLSNDSSNNPDNDGLTNLQEYQRGTNPQDSDSDDDSMPDGWEVQYGLNPLFNDSGNDPDNDGLTNSQEYSLGLNPTYGVTDSDGDQLPDWWEVQYFGLNLGYSGSGDPDNDELTNLQEYQQGTNPQDSDSDNDSMPDGWEVQNGLNPLFNDSSNNPDNDGLTNLQEYQRGTNPQDSDSDDDSMPDGWEVQYGLNPLFNDSGNDPDNDGLTNGQEYSLDLNPTDGEADGDGDQLPDWWEVQYFGLNLGYSGSSDPDNDELTNLQEYQNETDPQDSDSDDDSMPDGWEVQYGLDPLADDSSDDPDIDGFTNLDEYQHSTNPQNPDTISIDTTEHNLPWTDIVSKSEIVVGGGNINQHFILTIDFSKIHLVNVTEDDPFWLKYLRLFWDDDGNYIPNNRSETSSNTHTLIDHCDGPLVETEDWWNFQRWLRFNDENTQITRNIYDYHPYYWNGPFYDSRECVYQLYDNSVNVRNKFLSHHIMREIPSDQGIMYPSESGLGPNYHERDELGVTFRFKWILNEKVVLANDGYNYGEASYSREVRAGEVTEDGWAIVPQSPDMEHWFFIKPKSSSKDFGFGPCVVTEADIDGGDAWICSPEGWGDFASPREIEAFLEDGGVLGNDLIVTLEIQDRITDEDFDREGFYLLVRQPDGSYETSRRLSTVEAWDHIRRTHSLSINGSGNDFDNGIQKGAAMAEEMGLDTSVHYYMPQRGGGQYLVADNSDLRTALHYIFDQSRTYSTVITVQTHSWSGFVVSTSCNGDCMNINHISYAPATIPVRMNQLVAGYHTWLGRTRVVWGNNDCLLSMATYLATLAILPPDNIDRIEVDTGHSLDQILPEEDWSTYWREYSVDP